MPSWLVSYSVAATIVLGLVIASFYGRAMAAALFKAVRTRDDAAVGEDRYRYSLIGAVIAVLVSSLAIIAYGTAPLALYLGPIAVLLSPIAVIYCLVQEQKD